MKFTSQKEVNNKIRTTSVDPNCDTVPNSDWPEILTQGMTTCQETPRKISAWSISRMENYDCFRKTG